LKQKIIFQFTDKTLTVYQWSGAGQVTDSVYYLHNPEDHQRFAETAINWATSIGYILLNLSSEEYHQEQLPHIQGKDRQLMLERKLKKLFPNSDYTHYRFLKREKTGRRDDIYQLSGVTDTVAIEPYVDLINGHQIEIKGVYSTPLIIHNIIKPLKSASQVLVIATGKPGENNLPFRQTYLDGKLVHFNRLTAISFENQEELARKFNREIQRSWQYLNNRREIKPGVTLEVILIVPENVKTALNEQGMADHCHYVYVSMEELVQAHQAENKIEQPNFASLTAFLLGKTAYKKPHYNPEKLSFVHLHQQMKRYLMAASILLAVVTAGMFTNNLIQSARIKQAYQQIDQSLLQQSEHIGTLQSWFEARQTSPEKMEVVVTTARKLTETNPLPRSIFEIISRGYEDYDDLSLNSLEWKLTSKTGNSIDNLGNDYLNEDPLDEGYMDDSYTDSAKPTPSSQVTVTLKGEALNFQGNYRRSIERIEAFAENLRSLPPVAMVTIQKLPLDINPKTNISRSVAESPVPSFVLDIQLQSGARQ